MNPRLLAQGAFSQFADPLMDSINLNNDVRSIDGIINRMIPMLMVIGGIILFLMLIAGGFTLLTSATNPDQVEKGKKQITAAIIGFGLIFSSYWLVQIIEVVFGVSIF
jgi:acyl-CoA synthetase (AMP-forming)/AMP-acid ligase II